MKFGPKETKELNEYLRTGRDRKREFLGGERSGFAAGDIVTTPQLKNILKDYGVTPKDSTFSRVVKDLGIKSNEIRGRSTTWIEPSDEELKNIAEKNKIRRLTPLECWRLQGFTKNC